MSKRDEWQSEYKVLMPALEGLRREFARQLERLLANERVPLGLALESRIKEWHSIASKIDRVERIPALIEYQDLVGLRIVLLFHRDLDRIKGVIRQNFQVVKEYDSSSRQKTNKDGTQFGYSSFHFVVKPRREWLAIPTLADVGDLLAEIQLRTLAQHVWAKASEAFNYKSENDVPLDVRRGINRLSALLEIIDSEFTHILEQRNQYRSMVANSEPQRFDVDSLEVFLDKLLPPPNKDDFEDYAGLLGMLLNNELSAPSDLREIWNKWKNSVYEKQTAQACEDLEEILQELADNEMTEGDVEHPEQIEVIERRKAGIAWNHVELIHQALGFEYGLWE